MAKKLKKKLKSNKQEVKEQVMKQEAGDNSASIAINIQLVFEESDMTPERLLEISGGMQSFLDESVKDFAGDIGLEKYKEVNSLKKGQVEAVGRVGGKVFRAILTKEELK